MVCKTVFGKKRHMKLAVEKKRKLLFEIKINHSAKASVFFIRYIRPAITCLKLIIETLEQGVKYVQS